MLDVPGLTPATIHKIHEALGIDSLEELEEAARDGRLAKLPRSARRPRRRSSRESPRPATRLAAPLPSRRDRSASAARVGARASRRRPRRARRRIRRRMEIAGRIDIVAACRGDPVAVAQSFTRIAGVQSADGRRRVGRTFSSSTARSRLHCVAAEQFAVALWRATGNDAHVAEVARQLATQRRLARGRSGSATSAARSIAVNDETRGVRARRPGVRRAGAARGHRRGRRGGNGRAAGARRRRRHPRRAALPLASTPTARRSIAEMARSGAGARLEVHRHHRPFAGRVLRRRLVARHRCSRSTTRSTSSTRRSTDFAFSRASRRTFSPTGDSTTATSCSTRSTSSSARFTRASRWTARR